MNNFNDCFELFSLSQVKTLCATSRIGMKNLQKPLFSKKFDAAIISVLLLILLLAIVIDIYIEGKLLQK